MTLSPSRALPQVLEPLQPDFDAVDRIAQQLKNEENPTVRVEMTRELIRSASFIADTMERALYPSLAGRSPTTAERAIHESTRLRAAMTQVDHQVRQVAPSDVHRSDSEGFEQDLSRLLQTITEVREWEAATAFPLFNSFTTGERMVLHDQVAFARKHASEHPASAGSVGRVLHKVGAKLGHHLDTADTEP